MNWQRVDNDIPINDHVDNQRTKSVLSTTREFLLNPNVNNQNQSASFYLTRYEKPKKSNSNQDESPSSYFPLPQDDIKKSSLISRTNQVKDTKEWKTVPAPSPIPIRHSSNSLIDYIFENRYKLSYGVPIFR